MQHSCTKLLLKDLDCTMRQDSQYLLKLTGESLHPAESESTCSAATQASFDLHAAGGGSGD